MNSPVLCTPKSRRAKRKRAFDGLPHALDMRSCNTSNPLTVEVDDCTRAHLTQTKTLQVDQVATGLSRNSLRRDRESSDPEDTAFKEYRECSERTGKAKAGVHRIAIHDLLCADSSATGRMEDVVSCERYPLLGPEICPVSTTCSTNATSEQNITVNMNGTSLGQSYDLLNPTEMTAIDDPSSTPLTSCQEQTRLVILKCPRLRRLLEQLESNLSRDPSTSVLEAAEVDVTPVLRWKGEDPYLVYESKKPLDERERKASKWHGWHSLEECTEWLLRLRGLRVSQRVKLGDDVLVNVLVGQGGRYADEAVSKPARILRIRSQARSEGKLAFAVVLWYYDRTEARSTISAQDVPWPRNVRWVVSDHVDIVDCKAIVGLVKDDFHGDVSYRAWLSMQEDRLVVQQIHMRSARKHWQQEEPVWRKNKSKQRRKR